MQHLQSALQTREIHTHMYIGKHTHSLRAGKLKIEMKAIPNPVQNLQCACVCTHGNILFGKAASSGTTCIGKNPTEAEQLQTSTHPIAAATSFLILKKQREKRMLNKSIFRIISQRYRCYLGKMYKDRGSKHPNHLPYHFFFPLTHLLL